MAPLHVATLTVQRELPKSILIYTNMAPLHVATQTEELPKYLSRVSILRTSVPRMKLRNVSLPVAAL